LEENGFCKITEIVSATESRKLSHYELFYFRRGGNQRTEDGKTRLNWILAFAGMTNQENPATRQNAEMAGLSILRKQCQSALTPLDGGFTYLKG
jgi:hypothetical protein